MEEVSSSSPGVLEGEIVGIRFGMASHQEICIASISDCPVNHVSQLSNPFLGLPLEFGKCESCGTSEPGKCEGHFGYIELPVPIYHPCHITELKKLLSLLCLKCLKIKKTKSRNGGLAERLLGTCCEEASQISIRDTTLDGACCLELKLPSRSRLREGCWNFLERYGYRYGNDYIRPLLAREVKEILRRIPVETRRKLIAKGYFPQEGYILEYLPVPPNCLSVPDVSDGFNSMSSDPSRNQLKDVLKKVEGIKNSRSGETNFESHKIEANDLYKEVDNYLQVRGTTKASRNIDMRYGVTKVSNDSSTKAWLEKMRTLFIRKGSGFSSRTVITGDAYRRVDEVGVPYDIAQRITFEERVSVHNIRYLQDLVDNNLCLSFREGPTTYSLREGSKGHTFLKPGQVVNRRIMDGDIVFINRPPTTHKHSLQALRVYVHEDHTVKINPIMCGPFSADFDGDCVHLFYPQSLAAKAEVMELFSVEKQLLSSHSGQLNLQLGCDSLLSLRILFERFLVDKAAVQQLAMYGSLSLRSPALRKFDNSGPLWTALQILQLALPERLSCRGDRFLIDRSDLLYFDFGAEVMPSVINDMVASIFLEKGPKEALGFFDSLQPLLMEHLFVEGFSVSLEDLSMSEADMRIIHAMIQEFSPLLSRLRSTFEDELQLERSIQSVKEVAANFMLKSYSLRNLIDIKSKSSIDKLVYQIGFLGSQLSDKKRFYTKNLVEDIVHFWQTKYPWASSSVEFGFVKNCFFHGLDPYEGITHAIATREVIVRSSRGLAEPGTLFKNLMAVLRDIVICYDGTVRNTCNNSVVQFKYEGKSGSGHQGLFEAGEPVGVLAATAMSNPSYKAVLDSTPSSNSSWELMKEVLLCKVNFQNVVDDRRVILYLNECGCGKKYCQENAACTVKNQLKKISLKDTALEFLVEYKKQQTISENFGLDSCLLGHIHLDKLLLQELNISMHDILQKCEDTVNSLGRKKKKKKADDFKRTTLSVSDCCFFPKSCGNKCSDVPCLMFSCHNAADPDVERTLDVLSNTIYPALLETVVKGDPRICSASIVWNSSEMTTWIRSRHLTCQGGWVLDVSVEKSAVRQSGDAWRVVIDACLPVLHLIDTKRSIPYAVKQVQELLGISCAFEQAVQRLSAAVRMVSKGVLKEHLILLVNSMTCSGNMLGFNSGGYKALTRSLNIQAPFTEATLITPRKCFEKAAEKCHTDSLSTVVGSCSWGKHVAVGTGSRFDLLWNQKEAGLSNEEGTDVYSFLHMVRAGTNGDADGSCLGFDVDDFIPEEEMAEWADSPERDSDLGKATFEDSADFQNILDEGQPTESKWDKASSGDKGLWGGGSDWGSKNSSGGEEMVKSDAWEKGTKVAEEDGWTGWNKNGKGAQESNKSGAWEQSDAWGSKSKEEDRNDTPKWGSSTTKWRSSGSKEDKLSPDAWGSKSVTENSWGQQKSKDASKEWGSPRDSSTNSCGHKDNIETNERERNTWGTTKESNPGAWAQSNTDVTNRNEKNTWGTSKDSSDHSWGQSNTGNDNQIQRNPWCSGDDSNPPAWGQLHTGQNNHEEKNAWGAREKTSSCTWKQHRNDGDNQSDKGSWGERKEASPCSWGQTNNANKSQNERDAWGCAEESASAWQQPSDVNYNQDERYLWQQSKKESGTAAWCLLDTRDDEQNARNSWGSARDSSAAWDKPNAKDGNPNEKSSWESMKDSAASKRGQPNKVDENQNENDPWVSTKASIPPAWNKPSTQDSYEDDGNPWVSLNETNIGDNIEKERNQWGTPGRPSKRYPSESPRGGWSKGGSNWKGNKNRPPRPPGSGGNGDSSLAPMFTATRQRLDMFTSDEQDILNDVEPIMKTIRKIMHQSGYNDGDPISAEDQTFVLEKVLNFHPDKASKIGDGVDFVTVDRHSSFQESRCFYVVSSDGARRDFSYRKCLSNFIRDKYPELAEEFTGKYFRVPQNRNRNPTMATDATDKSTPEITEKPTTGEEETPQ